MYLEVSLDFLSATFETFICNQTCRNWQNTDNLFPQIYNFKTFITKYISAWNFLWFIVRNKQFWHCLVIITSNIKTFENKLGCNGYLEEPFILSTSVILKLWLWNKLISKYNFAISKYIDYIVNTPNLQSRKKLVSWVSWILRNISKNH